MPETIDSAETYTIYEFGTTTPTGDVPYFPFDILYINEWEWETVGEFFSTFFNSIFGSVGTWWNIYSVIAILLSLIFFVAFIYSKIRYTQLYEIQDDSITDAEAIWNSKHRTSGTKNARWDNIQQKVTEDSPESWRIAIIEADILLDETLTNAGYVGHSIGDKLKSANPESFTTVQSAWEAHKVRNEIAHVGSDFILTKKSAQDTVLHFERVFREFGVI